jgi:hypothetical protein
MRVNISKPKFFAEQTEYMGYWITRQGIQPMHKKVEAILKKLRRPKQENHNKLRHFIAIFNYYREMWFRRSELLARSH